MDPFDALLLRLRVEHAKPKAWRSGLEARIAERTDSIPMKSG